jgi:hypothetical protein
MKTVVWALWPARSLLEGPVRYRYIHLPRILNALTGVQTTPIKRHQTPITVQDAHDLHQSVTEVSPNMK